MRGDPRKLVATIARPHGGIWLVWGDGGVWAMDGAPFYGSYGSLPPWDAMAEPDFIGAAHWAGAEAGDGYYLIHRDVDADGGGIYRFDARTWRRLGQRDRSQRRSPVTREADGQNPLRAERR